MKYTVLLLLAFFLMASSVDDARKANEAFERGDYEQAAELYRRAIEEDPDNAKLHFNLASTLHKLGRPEKAMESYERFESLSKSPEEQSMASYNQGTMLTQENEYEKAAEYFKEALKKNPNDPDARHNYELALQRQQQQKQQEQQNQKSGEGNNQENDQQQQQDKNSGQNQNQEQNQNQSQQNNGQQQDEQQKNGKSQSQPQPVEMTPEQAENILDALGQLERELLENMKKEPSETQSANGKDW